MQELTYFLDFRQIISVLQIISRTITIPLKHSYQLLVISHSDITY